MNKKKGRPPYRFLPVALNQWHAGERGGNVLPVKRLMRKRQAGDEFFFGTFFLRSKRKYIYKYKIKFP